MSNKKKELTDYINQQPSESKFQMYRNLSYGAAGIQLIIIVLLVQVWKDSAVLSVTLYSAVAGIPLWVGLGGIYEYYILLGEQSYAHFQSKFAQTMIGFTFLLAGISILTSVGTIIYYLDNKAIFALAASVVAIIIIASLFHNSLEKALIQQEQET
jgi:cobalamin synthase